MTSHYETLREQQAIERIALAEALRWLIRLGFIAGILILLTAVVYPTIKLIRIDAGFEAVLVDKPLFIGKGGVQPETIKPGSKWVWRSTEVKMVDTRPFTILRTIDELASKDNRLLTFESAITVQVTDPVLLISEYGDNWFKSSLERPYLSAVREQVRGQTMSDLMSNQDTVREMDDRLTEAVVNAVMNAGLPIRIIDVNLGKIKPATVQCD